MGLGKEPLVYGSELYKRIERELMIEKLREEISVVEQLKVIWQDVGKAMSEAVPPSAKPDFITTFPPITKVGGGRPWEDFMKEAVVKPLEDAKTKTQEFTEEQIKAAQEIEEVWTEMYLKQEEMAYHAMRAPIIAAEKLEAELTTRHKRIAEDYASAMATAWTDAFMKMATEGKKFGEAMMDMFKNLLAMIMQIYMYRKIAEPMAYGLMGLPVPGTTAPAFTGPVTAHGVPYNPNLQHGGTVTQTGWAKVHKGETFSGVQGGGPTEYHIHNEGTEKLEISNVEEYMLSDRRIRDVTLQVMRTDVKYQMGVKKAARRR